MTARTHGHTTGRRPDGRRRYSKIYYVWQSMWKRCTNKKDYCYNRYGGRGITVCERWKSFENFLEDMGEAPEGLSLDRINNDGDYSPENCRWATKKEQSKNSANARNITYQGETMMVYEWAARLGMSPSGLSSRLRKWPLSKALNDSARRKDVKP